MGTNSNVKAGTFARSLEGGIDLQSLGTELQAQASAHGVDLARFDQDGDGKIAGGEIKQLFKFLDGYDGRRDSKLTIAASDGKRTAGGDLYQALKAEAGANRAVASGEVDKAAFLKDVRGSRGVIDTNRLSTELKSALAKAGVSTAELEAIAGPDGQIKSKAEHKQLFALLDGKDGQADGKLTTQQKDAGGAVSSTATGDLYAELQREVAANRKSTYYSIPGRTKEKDFASPQREPTIADAVTVDPQDQRPVDTGMKGTRQATPTACHDTCRADTKSYNTKHHGKDALKVSEDSDDWIQIGVRQDKKGRLVVDGDQVRRGGEYIDRMLDQGYPVMVGVSHKGKGQGPSNNDHLTDHWVTITGRGYDDQGRLYYQFQDPGSSRVPTDRFYVDEQTGRLFRAGDGGAKIGGKDYEVTRVQTYQE